MIHPKVFFILLLSSFSLTAQTQEIAVDSSATLAEQFETLERKSGNYRANGIRYEVVRVTALKKVKANVFDSIAMANVLLKERSAIITANAKDIEALEAKLQETTQMLHEVVSEKNSIQFFGTTMSKTIYKFIFWSVISALLLLLLFFVYRFNNSNALTRKAKAALTDLEKEYEAHKRRALEREQKISRELQDELNKQKKQ